MEFGTEIILRRLAKQLSEEIVAREDGHCLRVDHMTSESAVFLCKEVASCVGMERCYVLTSKVHRDLLQTELNTERAIELRNRKPKSFILLVPSGLTDSTASSLRNAFAVFDLDRYWLEAQQHLIAGLSDVVKGFVEKAVSVSRLPGVSEEDRATYCAAVSCADDKVSAATSECYRVALIPCSDLDLERLDSNARAAKEISRPIRSHSSLAERLDNVGVTRCVSEGFCCWSLANASGCE